MRSGSVISCSAVSPEASRLGRCGPRGKCRGCRNGPLSRPQRSLIEEPLGPILAVAHQPLDERAGAIELRGIIQIRDAQFDDADANRLVGVIERRMLFEQLIYLVDEVELLGERKIAREFVAPVGDCPDGWS